VLTVLRRVLTLTQAAARALFVATLGNAAAVGSSLVASGALAPLLRSVDADLRGGESQLLHADDGTALQVGPRDATPRTRRGSA
jgi:hypothetical protein